MTTGPLEVHLGGTPARFHVMGERRWGGPEVLLDSDDDLLAASPWAQDGYAVVPVQGAIELEAVGRAVHRRLARCMVTAGLKPPRGWTLARYHRLVDDRAHEEVLSHLGTYHDASSLQVDLDLLGARLSDVVGVDLSVLDRPGAPAAVGLRICRPGSHDNNPPHRDAWLDRLRSSLSVYVPLAGSTSRSSLTLVPSSHLWPEDLVERTNTGATVDGVRFSVPAVTAALRSIDMVRPNPSEGEMLVFSPYLIHGGARNWEPDTTRMSLEIRFERTMTVGSALADASDLLP